MLALEAHGGRAGGRAARGAARDRARPAAAPLDGAAADLEAEAARHAAVVEAAPLDLAVVGLDDDGGVALDAPPADHASGVRVVTLADGSRALTVGLGTLYRARELIVHRHGRGESRRALRAMLEEPAGPGCPASLLRDHPRLTVVVRPGRGQPADAATAVLQRSRARRPRSPRARHQP